MKEFKYTIKQVKEMHKRSKDIQIQIAFAKIIEAINLTKGSIAVSFSGGKDSGVMLYMASKVWRELYGDTKPLVVIFANTSNEFFSMHSFVKYFVKFLEEKFNIKIDLKVASAKKAYKDVVASVGYPFASKKVARMVSDVRKEMKRLDVTYEQIQQYIYGFKDSTEQLIEKADSLRKIGFSNTTVCNLTKIKQNNETGTCYIAIKWMPLLYAPFEISPTCCQILKKAPIKAVESTLGGLQPMIGEMADNSKTRMDSYRKTGCNLFDEKGKGVSKPLGAVTEETIKWYIKQEQIPVAPVYGKIVECKGCLKFSGEQNTGCKLCGFGIMFDWDRYERLAKIEPETAKKAFESIENGGLGYKQICEFLNKNCKCKIKIPDVS